MEVGLAGTRGLGFSGTAIVNCASAQGFMVYAVREIGTCADVGGNIVAKAGIFNLNSK